MKKVEEREDNFCNYFKEFAQKWGLLHEPHTLCLSVSSPLNKPHVPASGQLEFGAFSRNIDLTKVYTLMLITVETQSQNR